MNHRRSTSRVAAATVFGSLLLAACGGGSDDPVPAAATAEAGAAATAPGGSSDGAAESQAAGVTQAFATATAIDQPFDAASLAGRDAVVWFWAPWCTVCRAEAPDVNTIVERYGDQVSFVGVGGRGAIDEMEGFISDTETSGLPHVADLDGTVWQAFGVYAQPAFAFIDDSGEVEVFIGGLGEEALAERIDQITA